MEFTDVVISNNVAISLRRLLCFYKEMYEDTYDALNAINQIKEELFIPENADVVDITGDIIDDEWCACDHGFCTLARLIKDLDWYNDEIKVFLIVDL